MVAAMTAASVAVVAGECLVVDDVAADADLGRKNLKIY